MKWLTDIPGNDHTSGLVDLLIAPRDRNHGNLGLFIVMEFMQGDLKTTLIQLKNDFSIDHTIATLYNILTAMKFIHSSNILHRDIKPANILIDENCHIKLCDFGLARSLPDSAVGQGSGNSKRLRDGVMKLGIDDQAILKQKIAAKLT